MNQSHNPASSKSYIFNFLVEERNAEEEDEVNDGKNYGTVTIPRSESHQTLPTRNLGSKLNDFRRNSSKVRSHAILEPKLYIGEQGNKSRKRIL